MKCPACGAENPEGATFCNLCYGRLGEQSNPPQDDEERRVDRVLFPPELRKGPPPGPVSPPTGASPPARGPVSDAYRGRTCGAPPAAASVDDSGTWKVVVGAFALLGVIIILGSAIFYVLQRSKKPKTYTSENSSLTFEYPGNWKKVSMNVPMYMPEFMASDDPLVTNEIALADSTGNDAKYAFWSVTVEDVSPTDWRRGRTSLVNPSDEELSEMKKEGIENTQAEETTIGGSDAVSMTVQMMELGQAVTVCLAAVYNDSDVYLMALAGMEKQATREQWKEILDSVRFEG